MGRASREKGKRGERELANALRELGFDARRSQQFSGSNGTADVITSIPGTHWEVKRYSRIAACRFMDQAEEDSLVEDVPVVALREDRSPWMVMVKLSDLRRLAQTILTHSREMSETTSDSSRISASPGEGETDSPV